MPRYAILTHDDDYTVDWVCLDGYNYSIDADRIYDEIVAATRGRAKSEFVKTHHRSHVGFTDRMSVRLMTECECGGSNYDCYNCSGNKWYVPGGMWTTDGEIVNNA